MPAIHCLRRGVLEQFGRADAWITAWIARYHRVWDARFCRLDEIVEGLKRKESIDGRRRK